jgi:hypothetical protein
MLPEGFDGAIGTGVRAGIRPERVELVDAAPATGSRLPGVVTDVVYLGPLLQYVVDTAAGQLVVQVPSGREDTQLAAGQAVVATWSDDALLVLDTTPPEGADEADDGTGEAAETDETVEVDGEAPAEPVNAGGTDDG